MNTTTVYTPNTDIYKYSVNMKYSLNGKIYDIIDECIKSIVIDSDYDKLNMPMIFVTLDIYQTMANMMILNQHSGTFIMDLKKCVSNSDMPDLFNDYISDKFVYFITGEVDQRVDMVTGNTEENNVEDKHINVTLGLLSMDHVNKNKKVASGVIDGNLSSIMYYMTSHLPIVIEPPRNNVSLTNTILPPLDSVAKMLKYLNSLSVFYPTSYRFFIDFDKSYLMSSSGRALKAAGEDITSIVITIYHKHKMDAVIQGMTTNHQQAIYEMSVSSADCELSDNSLAEMSFSKISGTSTSGSIVNKTIAAASSSNIIAKSKPVRISNDNNGLIDNMISNIDNSAVQLLVQKIDVDGSKFTMNKEYIIRAEDAYGTEKYNGRYILIRKRELFIRQDTTFTSDLILMFRKVPE